MNRVCIICGKELSHKKRYHSKYCSVSCKRESLNRRRQTESITVYKEQLRNMRKNKDFLERLKKYNSILKKIEVIERHMENKKEGRSISRIIEKPRADVNDRFSYNGKNFCSSYDDTNITCVMCFENKSYNNKKCMVKPR